MFSILHISDLHRSPADAIDSESLVAALAADLDRYMRGTPHVPQPIAIVISGDLIEGAAIGASNWKQSIREQYQVTEDLLDRLCALFLSGNKKHMIVTPGNHDVCWNTAYKAMSRLTKSQYPSDVYASLTQTDSRYRWSWHDQKLYKIMNMSLYEERMNFYWEFVESFYSGVDLQFPLERGRGFQLFDLYERSVLIAAFDSINGNDCYNHAGSIAQASIGNCAMELRNISHDYELKVGLWHHSIQGPPLRSDYMDSSQVQEMIAHGFRLGLHGHQHVAGTLTQHVHLDERKEMAVVGAGSLCAGVGQLPRGQNRQYNLIVIEDEFDRARVHVREMGDGGQFTGKRSGAFLDGYAEVSWSPQTNAMGMKSTAKKTNDLKSIEAAERALKSGKDKEVIKHLGTVDIHSYPYAKKMLLDALLKEKRWQKLIMAIETPANICELIMMVSALIEVGQFDDAQNILDTEKSIDAGTRKSVQDKLEARRMMRQL